MTVVIGTPDVDDTVEFSSNEFFVVIGDIGTKISWAAFTTSDYDDVLFES